MTNSAQHPKAVQWRTWILGRVLNRWPARHLWFGGLGLGVLLLSGLYFALPLLTVGGSAALSGQTMEPAIVQIMPRPLVQSLALVGTVEPGNVVNVTAPFNGPIKEKRVDFGMRVERGQGMLVLDTAEVELQMRDAEVTAIKASQAVEDLKNWSEGSEAGRARTATLSAKIRVDELIRKERDSKVLLDRGIIPKNEYNAIASELAAQKLQWEAARQDYEAALKKGDAEHRHLAALQLENATTRLEDLQRQKNAGEVKAPDSGLVLRVAAEAGGKDATPADIQVGSRLSKGQALLSVADTQTLKIRASVNEIDVNRITEGQTVRVTGDAFGGMPLMGEVVQISAQAATSGSGSSRGAAFEVVVAVSALPPEQRNRVRIGMSANLTIVTYENAQALIVPTGAVQSTPGGNVVSVQDAQTSQRKHVPVTVGRATPDGVEILAGLQPGDSVVVEGGMPLLQQPFNGGQPGLNMGASPLMMGGGSLVGM